MLERWGASRPGSKARDHSPKRVYRPTMGRDGLPCIKRGLESRWKGGLGFLRPVPFGPFDGFARRSESWQRTGQRGRRLYLLRVQGIHFQRRGRSGYPVCIESVHETHRDEYSEEDSLEPELAHHYAYPQAQSYHFHT